MQPLALRFAEPAKLLIVIGIAISLARAGWYFATGPQPQAIGDAGTAVVARDRPPPLTVAEIIERNLFGDAGEATGPIVAESPPDTRLRLTLEGVFRADDPKRSAAIVAEQGRPGELFVVGDALPGNAILTEVFEDRIVFRRGASYETLRFSDEPPLLTRDEVSSADGAPLAAGQPTSGTAQRERRAAQRDSQRSNAPGLTDDAANRPLDDVVAEYRDRLEADPEGTLDSLGLAPVATDAAQGYRLGNLAKSPYLSQTGLQAGDVILSVNGEPVGNIAQDRMQIDNIVAQGTARLEVQRGDRRFFVTASLR